MESAAVVDDVCLCLKDIVRTSIKNNTTFSQDQNIPIKKKTFDLKGGDIVVPHFLNVDQDVSKKILDQTKDILHGKSLPVKSVTQDEHSILSFHLDRSAIFYRVFKQILEQGDEYGNSCKGQGHKVSLCPFLDKESPQVRESAMYMRISYANGHLKRLLEACRYTIITDASHNRISVTQGESKSHLSSNTNNSSSSKDDHSAIDESNVRTQLEGLALSDGVLDLEMCDVFKEYNVGKDGLDKNLNKVEVLTNDGNVTDVCRWAASVNTHTREDNHLHTLHLVPHNLVFRLQQVIVLQAALSKKMQHQSYLTVGPVVDKGKSSSVTDFQRLRYSQMKEASEMRHGIKCEGPEWENKIHQLSESGIKMEMLGTALHCPLKMNFESSSSSENRLGPFVLYNTARLSTLLRQFALEIENGTYPSLPPLEDINFSLLREQEEWELLFLYVATFPSVVSESVEVVEPERGKIAAKIHTHRITNFLISFSKSLSSYYSRYHILGGSESHLLPLMFARLHLVKACHIVMVNALNLLDIKPLDEL